VAVSGPQISDEARGRVGHVTSLRSFEPVSLRHVREYLAATGEWNPLHHDEEAARRSRHGQIVAPVFLFQTVCREIIPESELMADGQHASLGVEGVSGSAVFAGQEVELGVAVHVGDVISMEEKLIGIEEKVGRSGPLAIVTTEETYTNQAGSMIARTVTTRIFR
jgi:acyl dehydratase